ncbi:sensor histidine kinase [Bernardetia sp.]|uniref:sensor histidine kinase n=1 Tax=Bernardetia sp. TaxID=1937974 RepID=UPI0025BB4F26|nr:ATP-binding protein [Bernardetia sp.]
MNELRKVLRLIVYGDENRQYPDTYFEEQNYQCARLLPLVSIVFMFIWLGYIPLDRELYPNVEGILYLRVGLSVVSIITFGLYWIPFFRKNAIYLMSILGAYAVVSTAIITGLTKGNPSYMGGFCMVLVASLFVPLRIDVYYSVMLIALLSFFATLSILDVNIMADIPKYSLNDLVSAVILAFIFTFLMDRDRHSYYKKSKDRDKQRKQIQQQALLIQENNKELKQSEHELKRNLEELKTTQEELKKQKTEVENAYKELQFTQKQLIQSEKLASLGQLIANIAHEINTPLGAIQSSAEGVESILLETLPELPTFLKKLDDQITPVFNKFVEKSSKQTELLSTREQRNVKYKLIDELESLGFSNIEGYADLIADMNMQDEKEWIIQLLQTKNREEVFETAYQLSSIIRSNQTIKEATKRAGKTVIALKNFARQEYSEEKSEVDINQSLETTLVLYHNQIKHGIDIKRNLDYIPSFLGYPDELMQVWTNLIHNAIQAMKGKGELTISTQTNDNKVLISIEDTGGGIPKEIQNKIFDTFFTTKPIGEGSGLGLDITKKIIQRHDGKIWFESEEGIGTTFFIEIPIHQNKTIS